MQQWHRRLAGVTLALGTMFGTTAAMVAASAPPAAAASPSVLNLPALPQLLPSSVTGLLGRIPVVSSPPKISNCSGAFGQVGEFVNLPRQCTVTNTSPLFAASLSAAITSAGAVFHFIPMPANQFGYCTGTLSAGASCQLQFVFSPPTTGFYTGTLTVTATELGLLSPSTTLALSGIGVSEPTITGCDGFWGSVTVGLTSTPETCTITNTAPLTDQLLFTPIGSVVDPNEFEVLPGGTCPEVQNPANGYLTLAPGGSCTMVLQFAPVFVGQVSLPVWVVNESAIQSNSAGLGLQGTGVQGDEPPTISGCSGNFGNVAADTTIDQTCTLTNDTPNAEHMGIDLAPFSPAFGLAQGGTCETPGDVLLAPGGSCTFVISFEANGPSTTFEGQLDGFDLSVGGGVTLSLVGSDDS